MRSATQLAELVARDVSAPLPLACHAALVAMAAAPSAGGTGLVHGEGARVWHWGVPTPRRCVEAAVRRGVHAHSCGALVARALGDGGGAAAELRRRFVDDGFVKVPGCFPVAFAERLMADALARAPNEAAGMVSSDYFRARVRLPAPEPAACGALEAAIAQVLDAPLYGEHDALCGGFFRHASIASDSADAGAPFEADVTVHRGGESAVEFTRGLVGDAWRAPSAWSPCTMAPINFVAYHIDWGNGLLTRHHANGYAHDFSLDSTLRAPWLVVIVCLSDVVDDGGPTVLLRGSHRRLARLLSMVKPHEAGGVGGLDPSTMRALCAGAGASARARDVVRATGATGDVWLLHPLLVHSASVSLATAPRAILNIPHPLAYVPGGAELRLDQKQGALSGVTLPIAHALAAGGGGERLVASLAVRQWLLLCAIAAGDRSLWHAMHAIRAAATTSVWSLCLMTRIWHLACALAFTVADLATRLAWPSPWYITRLLCGYGANREPLFEASIAEEENPCWRRDWRRERRECAQLGARSLGFLWWLAATATAHARSFMRKRGGDAAAPETAEEDAEEPLVRRGSWAV